MQDSFVSKPHIPFVYSLVQARIRKSDDGSHYIHATTCDKKTLYDTLSGIYMPPEITFDSFQSEIDIKVASDVIIRCVKGGLQGKTVEQHSIQYLESLDTFTTQVFARPINYWSFYDHSGNLNAGLVWELDLIYLPSE